MFNYPLSATNKSKSAHQSQPALVETGITCILKIAIEKEYQLQDILPPQNADTKKVFRFRFSAEGEKIGDVVSGVFISPKDSKIFTKYFCTIK